MVSNTNRNQHSKIVVIGAGLVVLTAAYRLKQQGQDVNLYEARNRVGGRVLTAFVNDSITELGGHYITAADKNENIRRLVAEFGLQLTESKVNTYDTYFDGKRLVSLSELYNGKQINPTVIKSQIDELIKKYSNMKEVLEAILQKDDLLFQVMATKLAAFEGASLEKLSSNYAHTLLYFILKDIESIKENSNREQYTRYFSIEGGNSLLPEKIAEKFAGHIHFEMVLKKISKIESTFLLIFQNGKVIKADTVVLSIPSSVYSSIIFEDNLISPQKLESIRKIECSQNAKMVLPVESPIPHLMRLISKQMVSFIDEKHDLLTMSFTGQASLFSSSTVNDLYRQYMPALECGFGDQSIPSVDAIYAEDRSFSSYHGPVGYCWPNDLYARGAFSFISPGNEFLFEDVQEIDEEMRQTLFASIDGLFFAGEHTTTLTYALGTMEAACESGERTARMVLRKVFKELIESFL